MKLLPAILLLFALVGCSALKKDNEPQKPTDLAERMEEVKAKQTLYCELSQGRYEAQGWVHSKCDALLFTSLHGLTCSYAQDPKAFEKSPGLWKRSPSHDCFALGESKTGISRDMLVGLVFLAWQYERLDILDNLVEYGEDHGWDMCGGEYEDEQWRIGRCLVSPTLKATIYEVAVKLGRSCDTRCQAARAVPQAWDPHETDFAAHLLQLQILLRGLVQGALNDNQVDQLRWQAGRVPENALFQANLSLWTDGDMAEAISVLLNPLLFPETSLPTSSEHCTDYLWQRDPGTDWEPCPQGKEIHYGTDYLMVSAIILGQLRGQNGPPQP